MASKFGPLVVSLVVILAVVLTACTRVQLTGNYTPRHVHELAPEIPVVVRNVAVQNILTGKHVEPGSAHRLSLAEEGRIRQETRSAIQRDHPRSHGVRGRVARRSLAG